MKDRYAGVAKDRRWAADVAANCERVWPNGDGSSAAELGVLPGRVAGARLAHDGDVPRDDVYGGLAKRKRRSRLPIR